MQLVTLDYLSSTEHIRKMTFIGGTNLRLAKGIDRFSEDLDFDCKNLSEAEFIQMSDDVCTFLQRSGLNVRAREREKSLREPAPSVIVDQLCVVYAQNFADSLSFSGQPLGERRPT